MKNLISYDKFLNEGMNEANISFYKNVVQNAIKASLGHDVKQSDVKVGAKKQSGGYDMITLNGELLCSSSQYDEMLRWATNAIKEDPAKYGLKESVTTEVKKPGTGEIGVNEGKGPDWNRKDFDDVYWKDFIDTAKKNRIKTISDLLKLMDKKLPSISGDEWDETKKILNIVESVNESNNLVYITDKRYKSAEDIMNSFQKNAGPAWEKFISDKMGITAKAITGVSRRGDAVYMSTHPISKKDLGVFAHVFNEVTIEGVDGVINHQMVNNMQFEFSPAIFFRIDIDYNHISGGSNGASIILPGSSTYNNMIMYDIVENRFLDQSEGNSAKAKYWVSGSGFKMKIY